MFELEQDAQVIVINDDKEFYDKLPGPYFVASFPLGVSQNQEVRKIQVD
jgi:hypothetical protein